MKIFPAIDIRENKVVRLYKGRYDEEKIYSMRPEIVAAEYQKAGAKNLHIVDLDGALEGEIRNRESLKRIRKYFEGFIEFGGGIRTKEDAQGLTNCCVDRIILGTIALTEEELLEKIIYSIGSEKIAISLDVEKGNICIRGWVSKIEKPILEVIEDLEKMQIKHFIITNIEKDGTLEGVDINFYETIAKATQSNIIISGGVKDIDDIKKAAALSEKYKNIEGIIIGKALYEKKVDLAEAISIVS